MKIFVTRWGKVIGGAIGALCAATVLIVGGMQLSYPAITSMVGLAVAQTATQWNNVIDAAKGDGQQSGILGTSLYLFNGTTFDRVRGDITNGIDVDVTRLPASVGVQPVQGMALLNSETTSAIDTILTKTLTGVAGTRIHLYSIQASCNLGSASLSIADGGTVIYSTQGGNTVPQLARLFEEIWPAGLTFTTGANAVITVSQCGTGGSSILTVQADQF